MAEWLQAVNVVTSAKKKYLKNKELLTNWREGLRLKDQVAQYPKNGPRKEALLALLYK